LCSSEKRKKETDANPIPPKEKGEKGRAELFCDHPFEKMEEKKVTMGKKKKGGKKNDWEERIMSLPLQEGKRVVNDRHVEEKKT